MPEEVRPATEPGAAVARDVAEAANSPAWLRGVVGRREGEPALQLFTGHLTRIDDEGGLHVQPEGQEASVPVTIGVDASDGVLVRAVRRKRRVLVLRTADAIPRWILVGFVRERIGEKARDAKPGRLEVTVDGEKVKLEAEHDIELKCGQASITLRYDGRIEVRGTHILSASRGPNRVKGATIDLN